MTTERIESFSHTDINKSDLDVTGGCIHAYLFEMTDIE